MESHEINIQPELPVLLKWLHRVAIEPPDQSIRGGTQVNLREIGKYKVIRAFRREMAKAITERIGPDWRFEGIWSNSLNSGGFHVKHVHPKGWLSGVCYIDIPDDTSGLFRVGDKTIRPQGGKWFLFPSNLSHEVTIYRGLAPRLSIAFDIARTA